MSDTFYKKTIFIFGLFMVLIGVTLTSKNSYAAEHNNWMKNLPDNQSLSKILIPGTHDTMTYNYENSSIFFGGTQEKYVKTQDRDLLSQLNMGIRYLDIRVNGESGDIYHGTYPLNKNINEVFLTTQNFLRAHPSEFVIMRIKDENREPSLQTAQKVLDTLNEYRESVYFSENNSTTPLLSDIRGKIFVLNETATQFNGIWKYGDDSNQVIQDDYNLPWVDTKVKEILQLFDSSNTDNRDNLYINHLSATAVLLKSPKEYAFEIQPKILNFFKNTTLKYRGIVPMDYPMDDLVEVIINNNFS